MSKLDSMGLQEIIIVLIVAGALYYLGRKLFYTSSKHSGNCNKCDPPSFSKQNIKNKS